VKLAYVAWVAICLIWGTTYLAIRVALDTVPVVLLAGLRWFGAGVALSAILVLAGRHLPGPRHWGPAIILGFLMNVIGNGLVVWAEQYVSSGLTAVLVAMAPFWTMLIESSLPRGERYGAGALIGLAVGLSGIVVLVWPQLMAGDPGHSMVWGIAALQVACAGWAAGTSYSKRHTTTADPMAASALQMICSGVMLLALGTALGEWRALSFTPRTLGAMIYLSLFGSLIAYTAYVYAVKHLPLTTVSLYAYINPIIAVALGTWLLAEPYTARILAAAALVLVGIAIVRRVQSARVVTTPTPRRAHA
jgi:drug/metabolite transporter (DMT)-like permease